MTLFCCFLTLFFLMKHSIGHDIAIQNKKEENQHSLIQQLIQEMEQLKTRVDDQQRIIEELKSKVRYLENEKEDQKSGNSDLKHITSKETASSNSKETINTNSSGYMEDPSISVNPDLHSGQNNIQRIRRLPVPVKSDEGPLAFYAFLSSDEVNPSRHHTLVFDYVKTNTVNAYNKFTGAFTVPTQGLYVFTTTVYVQGYIHIDMIVNNDAVTTIYPDSGNKGPWVSATGIAVVNVNVGDIVLVRTRSDSTPVGTIKSNNVLGLSTFSGWMIA